MVLYVLAFCTKQKKTSKEQATINLTRAGINVLTLFRRVKEEIPLLRSIIGTRDKQNLEEARKVDNIAITFSSTMAELIATTISNPLLLDLNLLPDLTHTQEQNPRKLTKGLPSEQSSMQTLCSNKQKSSEQILSAIAGLLDLRLVSKDKLDQVIARHLILVRLTFWTKLSNIKDEEIIEQIAEAYDLASEKDRIKNGVKAMYLQTSLAMIANACDQTEVDALNQLKQGVGNASDEVKKLLPGGDERQLLTDIENRLLLIQQYSLDEAKMLQFRVDHIMEEQRKLVSNDQETLEQTRARSQSMMKDIAQLTKDIKNASDNVKRLLPDECETKMVNDLTAAAKIIQSRYVALIAKRNATLNPLLREKGTLVDETQRTRKRARGQEDGPSLGVSTSQGEQPKPSEEENSRPRSPNPSSGPKQ